MTFSPRKTRSKSVSDILSLECEPEKSTRSSIQFHLPNMDGELEHLQTVNKQQAERISLLEQLVIKISKKVSYLEDRLVDQTSRSMKDNVIISNIPESENENCLPLVEDFLEENLDYKCTLNEVLVAHRMGKARKDDEPPRSLVVRMNPRTKEKVLTICRRGKLNKSKGANGKSFSVSPQQPEAVSERKKKAKFRVKQLNAINSTLPAHQRATVQLVNGNTVLVNSAVDKPKVVTPTIEDTIDADPDDLKKAQKINIAKSDEITEDGSTFIGFACKVKSAADVHRAYLRLKREYASTDDIMCAYSIPNGPKTQHVDYLNDQEHGGGYSCIKALGDRKNTAVFVSRSFFGKHIGGKRFFLIQKAGEKALERLP